MAKIGGGGDHAVPVIAARKGLSPSIYMTCLAHQKGRGWLEANSAPVDWEGHLVAARVNRMIRKPPVSIQSEAV